MKPYGMHRTGHTGHPHNTCGICSAQAPMNSSTGRAYIKREAENEVDLELDNEYVIDEELTLQEQVSVL